MLLAIGVLLMALNTMANVVGRYLLGQSIFFSEELNQALIILDDQIYQLRITRAGKLILTK